MPGQQATERPDLVARVFQARKLRFRELARRCFCERVMEVDVVELQKRGLPHLQLLLGIRVGSALLGPDVDDAICAEIPAPGPLRDMVLSMMVHAPCGAANPKAPCMKDGVCQKRFPMAFQSETVITEDGYSKLRRRSPAKGGHEVVLDDGRVIDNSWIVPYNPFLLLARTVT